MADKMVLADALTPALACLSSALQWLLNISPAQWLHAGSEPASVVADGDAEGEGGEEDAAAAATPSPASSSSVSPTLMLQLGAACAEFVMAVSEQAPKAAGLATSAELVTLLLRFLQVPIPDIVPGPAAGKQRGRASVLRALRQSCAALLHALAESNDVFLRAMASHAEAFQALRALAAGNIVPAPAMPAPELDAGLAAAHLDAVQAWACTMTVQLHSAGVLAAVYDLYQQSSTGATDEVAIALATWLVSASVQLASAACSPDISMCLTAMQAAQVAREAAVEAHAASERAGESGAAQYERLQAVEAMEAHIKGLGDTLQAVQETLCLAFQLLANLCASPDEDLLGGAGADSDEEVCVARAGRVARRFLRCVRVSLAARFVNCAPRELAGTCGGSSS